MLRVATFRNTGLAYRRIASFRSDGFNTTYRRSIAGIGDIIGVLTAPGQTLQQLGDVRRELQQAKTEMEEARERERLPPVRTFIRTPGYYSRPKEEDVIKRILEGPPNLTIVFGASSVGKTAILRQILTSPRYLVLPIDLRIAGFADTASMYYALSAQFEQYFSNIGDEMEGYREECDNIALSFKHSRLDVERRVEKGVDNGGIPVGTSDMAALFEDVQNSLVRYWRFQPKLPDAESKDDKPDNPTTDELSSPRKKPDKRVPVWLIDEAHNLPALLEGDEGYLKTMLDAMVVLTKQERLCHVIHATSDSFYMELLIQMNVAQHAKFVHVDDPDKATVLDYVKTQALLPVPKYLHNDILDQFDTIYDIIGGKFVHWDDTIREWADEGTPITQSSHVSQAYILVNSFLQPPFSVTDADTVIDSSSSRPPPMRPTVRLFSRLSAAEGHVEYYAARREFGSELIDALVRSRLVEVRWGGVVGEKATGDRRPNIMQEGVRKPVLVPMTPVIKWGMKQVVRDLAA